MAQNPDTATPGEPVAAGIDKNNPYLKRVEDEESSHSTDDVNLLTAYTLISSHGLESAIGQMMAHYAEQVLPYTIVQLFNAYEKAIAGSNVAHQSFRQNLRGMIIFSYAWAYVMSRTNSLSIKDRSIYPSLAEISASDAGSELRLHLTKTAENRLESTLGLLLHSIDDAGRQHNYAQKQFFEGSLQLLYALANLHYGKGVDRVE